MLSLNMAFVRSDEATGAAFGDEAVLMRVNDGKFFTLDAVGARIWELLAEPSTLEGLEKQLIREFKVEPDRCRLETANFIEQLLAWGLVRQCAGTA